MLRKSLIALTATAALGVSSVAMAATHGGGHTGGTGHPSGMGGMNRPSMATMSQPGNFSGPRNINRGPGHLNRGPTTFNRGPNTFDRRNFASNRDRDFRGDRGFRHHRHHDRFFFGVGFADYGYGYGYDSCWVPTYWGGWQYVCGYPYWGY
jgi:hypothetical protein